MCHFFMQRFCNANATLLQRTFLEQDSTANYFCLKDCLTLISSRIMKRLLLAFVLAVLCSNCLYAQEAQEQPFEGHIFDAYFVYPLISDDFIDQLPSYKRQFCYPTLVVNNMVITDKAMIDCFRNHYEELKNKGLIVKRKPISVKKAQRRGIYDVSADGALIIKTKRNFYFDLANCGFYERE